MNVLIVDDEALAIEGIESGVNWGKLGVDAVFTASNIRRGKDIIIDNSIDILICDIELPQGNGLQLLTWVKEAYPLIEAVILTCHAEFEYAQKAVQLGSLEYLLKPIAYEHLESTIQRAIDKIIKERELEDYIKTYKHYHDLWQSHQPLLIEHFWLDILQQKIPSSRTQIKEKIITKNIPYSESMQFLPILISVQRWHKSLSVREEKIMEYALRNAAEEMIMHNVKLGQVVNEKKGILMVMIPVNNSKDYEKLRIKKDCEMYIESCNRYFFCDLCCYIGTPVFIHEILDMYNSLLRLESNNINRSNQIYFNSDQRIHLDHVMTLPDIDGLLELLRNGSKELLINEILDSLNSWMQTDGLNASWLQKYYHGFLQVVYHILQEKGLQALQIFSDPKSVEMASLATRSIKELQEWCIYIIERACEQIYKIEASQTVVEKIKIFINAHLDHDLTREEIANHFYLNSDYLTRIFKKETGVTVIHYLHQQRIKRAEILITTTNKSISDIAALLRYSSLSHFSVMFKKYTNQNPMEFRKQKLLDIKG